ncbi:MAG: glycosyltransferase family 4 protein [Acidobacteriaceae bacterium]
MKVLIAAGRFHGDQPGGAARIAWDCAVELVQRGNDVVLLCEGSGGTAASEQTQGVRLVRYVPPNGRNRYQCHRKAAIAAMKEQLTRADWAPDFIWGHAPFQFLAATDLFRGVRSSYVVHSPLPLEIRQSGARLNISLRLKSRAGKRIERTCLKRARAIQVLSRYTSELLQALYGKKVEHKVRVAPGWTDTGVFHPYSESDRKLLCRDLGWVHQDAEPVLFTLRRLVPRMGIDRLIEAAAILAQRGLAFHIYIGGEGELRASLARQIELLGLSLRVTLLGGIAGPQLAHCYAACDAFIIPTTALECFGLIALEALSTGVPVLSTPVGALPEIIAPIEPRWLARDNSAPAIAAVLAAFLNGLLPYHDPQALHRYVEGRFSHGAALANFCDVALEKGR